MQCKAESDRKTDRIESISSESQQSVPLIWKRANPDSLLKHFNKMSDYIGKTFIKELQNIKTDLSKIKRFK